MPIVRPSDALKAHGRQTNIECTQNNMPTTPPWKCVWITGASSGLGRELAIKLANEGVCVAASARSHEKLQALAASHDTITSYPLDVTDAAAVAQTARRIHAERGPVDLAILNAGICTLHDAANFSATVAAEQVSVNYLGVVNAVDPLVASMVPRGSGHIAIVASVAGYRGLPDSTSYGPTKAALINLAEALHLGLEPKGLTISVINTGYINTPMTQQRSFEMPFIVEADDAAQRILQGLKKQRYEIAFPLSLVAVLKLGRILTNIAYFRFARRFLIDRKPRSDWTGTPTVQEKPAAIDVREKITNC